MSDFTKELSAASSLQLWQSYCEKKMECESLQDQLTTITNLRDELINTITEQEKVIGDLEKKVERLTLEKLAAINFDYYSKQSKGE